MCYEVELISDPCCTIVFPQPANTSFGSYLWPSALVLSQYLIDNPATYKDKVVLELGAGVSLPGIICAKLGAASVTLSDQDGMLATIREIVQLNQPYNAECRVHSLSWGHSCNLQVDTLLGADIFYEPADFEALIVTVSSILTNGGVFLTAYQERSAKRNIAWLLEKHGLKATAIEYELDLERVFSFNTPTWYDNPALTSVFLFEITKIL